MSKVTITDSQCWAYIFDAFGGGRHTPPAVDRHPELAWAIRRAYMAGLAAAPADPAGSAGRDRMAEALRTISDVELPEHDVLDALRDVKGVARHALWVEGLLPPSP